MFGSTFGRAREHLLVLEGGAPLTGRLGEERDLVDESGEMEFGDGVAEPFLVSERLGPGQ